MASDDYLVLLYNSVSYGINGSVTVDNGPRAELNTVGEWLGAARGAKLLPTGGRRPWTPSITGE